MAGSCRYFDSTDWEERLTRYVARSWDLEGVVRAADGLTFEEPLLDRVARVGGWPSPDAVAEAPIGEVLSSVETSVLDIPSAELLALWRDEHGDGLPEQCPHETHGDEQFCLFHVPPAAYDRLGVEPADVRDALVEAVDRGGRHAKTFVGSRFDVLDLENRVLASDDHHPIDLRFIEVARGLQCAGTVFGHVVRLKGSRLGTDADGDGDVGPLEGLDQYVGVGDDIDFLNATFHGKVDCKSVDVRGTARFVGASFEGSAMFNHASFAREADFMAATFESKADFSKATFGDDAYLNAQYEAAAICNYTTFTGDVDLWSTEFGWKAEFRATDVGGRFNASYATFRDDARFAEVRFGEGANFRGAVFDYEVRFRDVASPGAWVDLSDAHLTGGRIDMARTNRTYYDLTDATVGTVELRGRDDAIAYLRVYRTTFDGFDFAAHAESLRPDWDLLAMAGEPPARSTESRSTLERLSDREATYLKAKNGATGAGHNKAASEFFRREMVSRRYHHLAMVRAAPFSRRGLAAAWRWTSNAVLDYTTGYGERPRRVAVVSVGVLVSFALLFLAITEPRPRIGGHGLDSLLLSVQSFTTFILGGAPEQPSQLLEFLTALEGLLGAFLIALLVFTLTRSIHR